MFTLDQDRYRLSGTATINVVRSTFGEIRDNGADEPPLAGISPSAGRRFFSRANEVFG